jgi:DNA-binding CsgD family transcriptional regulator
MPATSQRAEGLERESWSAWWRDDGDAAIAAREAAFAAYRERGDDLGAARMATWLAADEADFRGAAPVASGWLERARRLLEEHGDAPEHGWFAFHEGYAARLRGDDALAIAGGERAAALGRSLAVPDLEMLGLALDGATRVTLADVAEGMRRLDEATTVALAGEAALAIAPAWTCCFLVSACMAVQDYERAAIWCARIGDFADRHGSRYMLAFCRAEYGGADLACGRWAAAEALLETAAEDWARTRPAMAGGAIVALAELRRRQGRPQEAEALLARAPGSAAAELVRARLALDGGEAHAAAEGAERALRRLPEDAALARAPALELLAHARAAARDAAGAEAALRPLRAAAARAGTRPLRARTDLAAGLAAAAAGRHDEARPLLEDAADGFGAAGVPYERATARRALAASLAALGRHADAERERNAAAASLAQLRTAGDRPPPLPALSAREREVLALVAGGATNRQVAERLVLSEHTVHRHVANILRKLDLPSRAAAAAVLAREMARTGDDGGGRAA